MFDIVYCISPQIYTSDCPLIDDANWVEVTVTDSEHVYDYKRFTYRFKQVLLSDDFEKTAKVLWSIKEDSEQVVFYRKYRDKYFDRTIITCGKNMFEQLESTEDRKMQYVFTYLDGKKVNKIVCNFYYENIKIYVRKKALFQMEKQLEGIAEKGNYYQY